jgi:polyphosphate kinase 2 (PPK2 family)
MIERTSTPQAPWTIVAAENKDWARDKVLETVITAMVDGLSAHGLDVPAS